MSNPYGGPPQYSLQPSAAYGAYWPGFPTAESQRTPPAIKLVWLVFLLGLATYLVSYGVVPSGSSGWGVRFATLTAVVAALGLVSWASAHTKLIAALAVMGFLEALSHVITGSQNPGWAATVIAVLVGLQALAAIAALMTGLNGSGGPDRGLAPYEAYAYYAQAAQQYYAADNPQPQQRQPVQAQATAQAAAAAPAQAQRSTAERDALYAEYLGAQQSGPSRAAASPQSGERMRIAQPASGIDMSMTGPAESIRPGIDPATGSPPQSL